MIFAKSTVFFIFLWCKCNCEYLIGRGIADVTGLVSEGGLYGYGRTDQDARGMHTRQYARTFILCDVTGENDDVTSERGKHCVVVVTVEITMSTQSLHDEVIRELRTRFGNLYTARNVLISATHSHAAPGGVNTYWMYSKPTGGVIEETFNLYVNGIVQSIELAHADLAPSTLHYGSGELLDASANRSPYAYEQNPQEERDRFPHDVDKEMHVLKMTRHDGSQLGMLNLFPVHLTSMKNRNHLVSSDNKGYAAQMFERALNPHSLPGQGPILGAFAQTAEGDVTPNVAGDFCRHTRKRCHYRTSTCDEDPADPTLCNSEGPAGEEFEDTKIIGHRQFLKALELYRAANEVVSGSIESRHLWATMAETQLPYDGSGPRRTCKPAMGYSFPAGATDGPGVKPFIQSGIVGGSATNDAIAWMINMFLSGSQDLKQCHAPKPIAIPSGEMSLPYPWQPEIVLIQLFKIGNLYLVTLPAEVTTMSGRRLEFTIRQTLEKEGITSAVHIFVMSLSNGYTGYVTTAEEYRVQRYEGAATAYGPHTLAAYQQYFANLARALAKGQELPSGRLPPDMRTRPGEALGELVFDDLPWGSEYGKVLQEPQPFYHRGDTVEVSFQSGNPRAAAQAGSNTAKFILVERKLGDTWMPVYDEASWETKFLWKSNCHDASLWSSLWNGCGSKQRSTATVQWVISDSELPGIYRISHSGYAKTYSGNIMPYMGSSRTFHVQ